MDIRIYRKVDLAVELFKVQLNLKLEVEQLDRLLRDTTIPFSEQEYKEYIRKTEQVLQSRQEPTNG